MEHDFVHPRMLSGGMHNARQHRRGSSLQAEGRLPQLPHPSRLSGTLLRVDTTEIARLAELEDKHWWYAERRHMLARRIRGLKPGLALDVGAAAGGNTRVLRDHGWTSCAVEYSASGAELAAGRGLRVVRGDATSLPVRSESVDLVVAYDVLEHIPDDESAAAEIFRSLRPGGTFLVAVPCDPQLWSAHDEAVDHVRRYTRDTLRDLLLGAGFVLEPLTSWNVLMRPLVALRRRSKSGSDLEHVPRVLNAALTLVIRLERYLPVGRLPGVTLFVTARRPEGSSREAVSASSYPKARRSGSRTVAAES